MEFPRSTYAVSMDCPHATIPDVLWTIHGVRENIRPEGVDNINDPQLWVPRLETWTLDTLRMVLHELAAYLPPHDEAMVTVLAKVDKHKGRKVEGRQPPRGRFNERVEFQMTARGASLWVNADRNEVRDDTGRVVGLSPGEWSEPMQEVLLDLAKRSPFALSAVRIVDCGDRAVLGLKPSRRDKQLGRVVSLEAESRNKRIKRLVKNALEGE